jgi:competence protein ComEC
LYIKPYLIRNTIIYYIDVGQGDNSLIVTKNNKSSLIDSGGKTDYYEEEWKKKNQSFNLMKDSIIPFYKSIGIKKINYAIFSHGDYDHMGYAKDLINNFNVGKVIVNCGNINELETDLINLLKSKNIPYYLCIEKIDIDNIKLSFLKTKEYDNENDNSNVIYTEIEGYKFLFMGDASITTEKEILDKYNLSKIDVLKVGHHGSKTSSSKEFIGEVKPNYSIISVGKNNRYGHPNKEVLETLKDSKIYRTDKDGSIMFKIKNNELKIETCSL